MVFPYPLSFSPDPPDSLISQTREFKPWGDFECRALTNRGAFKVISIQMGYNIALQTPNMVISLMDESGTLEGRLFSVSNQKQIVVSPVFFFFKHKVTNPHLCVSLRWRRHGRPVSQPTLPAPGGSPLPQPLNVAPSLSSLFREGDSLWLTPVRTMGISLQTFGSTL